MATSLSAEYKAISTQQTQTTKEKLQQQLQAMKDTAQNKVADAYTQGMST